MSYSALSRQWDRTWTRTPALFDSYLDSDDDFDLDSDSLDCQGLTILATPQSRVIFWKNSESTDDVNNARMVACLRDLPYQPGRPLSPVRGEEVGDIALVNYSMTHSTPDRQVYVSLHGDESALGSQADQYANESLDQILDDELLVTAPHDESLQDKKAGDNATTAAPLAESTQLLELSVLRLRTDRKTCIKTWTKQPTMLSTVL